MKVKLQETAEEMSSQRIQAVSGSTVYKQPTSHKLQGAVEHVIRNLDLTGLTTGQRNTARTMLLEELESFADDIGCILELELNINISS